MSEIGKLLVRIGVDTTELDEGIGRAVGQVKKFRGAAGPVIKTMAAAGAAAAVAAAGVVAFTKASSDNARELTTLSQVANTSTQTLQRMAFGTRTVSIEQDKLADILKDVNDRIGDFMATGGGPMADFFENIAPQIGVTAQQFRNLSGPQALQLYYSSLERANLSQADMTFYMETMASDATALIPLLRDNGSEMARFAKEAEALGIVMSDVDLASLRDFGEQFDRMQGVVQGITNQLSAEFAPILAEIADRITNMAVEAGGFGSIIETVMDSAVTRIGKILDALQSMRIGLKRGSLAVAAMDLAFAEFAQSAWVSVSGFIDDWIEGLNKVISIMNKIPGMGGIEQVGSFSESEFMGRIAEQADIARDKVNLLQLDLNELENQQKPSEYLNKFMEDVEARRAAFRAQFEGNGGVIPGLEMGGDGGASEEQQKNLEKMREQLAQRVEMLRESLLTEREIELERYQTANEDLREALELDVITKQEYDELERENHQAHVDKITAMDEQAANRREELARQVAQQEIRMRQDVVNLAAGLLQSLGRDNKAFALASIALTKGMAIAQTIAHTQTASMLAYASQLVPGEPTSPARGALAALKVQKMGAIKVGLIAAQGLVEARGVMSSSGGGGGGVSAGGSGGGGGGSTGGGQPAQPAAPSGGTLTVQGISAGSLFSGEAMKELAEEMLEYQRRGGQVVIQ